MFCQREVESVTEVRLHCGVNHESFFNFKTFRCVLSNKQCPAAA